MLLDINGIGIFTLENFVSPLYFKRLYAVSSRGAIDYVCNGTKFVIRPPELRDKTFYVISALAHKEKMPENYKNV